MGKSHRRTRSNKRDFKKILTVQVNGKVMIGVFTILLLFVISTIFAVGNMVNTKILARSKVEQIKVAGLEIDEAYQKVKEEMQTRKEQDILLISQDYETTINLEQLEVQYDSIQAVNSAYKMGRNKNIIISNYQIVKTFLVGNNITQDITWNEQELEKAIEDIASKIPGVKKESSYYIEENNLILYAGQKGLIVEQETLKKQVKQAIKEQMQGKGNQTILIPTKEEEPTVFNIEQIYQEIYKEPQDASYNEQTHQLVTQKEGIDFAISIEEVKKLLEQKQEEYVIPLKITKPKISIESLGVKVFPDQLGRYTTRYDESNKNRTNNIKLASEKIEGTILMPGETFSYNKIVGERTIKAGYKEAAVYMGGKVVDGIGGGICQVSSTLYNAVLDANLEIIKRSNHYFLTSYVPASRDATVSYGSIDFQFKNNRTYPIKVECTAKNGISQVSIYGIKEETEYEVIIQDEITEVLPYTTKYIETSSLTKGQENIVQQGSNGYKSQAYKILKLNGKVVSKTLLSKDSYHPMERIIEIGTK